MDANNYTTTNEQKALQTILLELSDIIIDICDRLKLRIWAGYGTLLGAVRHNGFIPWDDDMDFIMMRKDYDILLTLIKSHSPLLQLPTNVEFDITNIRAIKLRKSDTTMHVPSWKYSKDINAGIWLDVFAMDVAPDDLVPVERQYEHLKRKIRICIKSKL